MIRTIYFLTVFISCNFSQQQSTEVIDAKKLKELQSNGVLVFDIRTKNEFDRGHISNVINVDFYDKDFVEKVKELSDGKPIIIHCAKGGRSGKAAIKLSEAGLISIYDYSGGFSDWESKGFDVE